MVNNKHRLFAALALALASLLCLSGCMPSPPGPDSLPEPPPPAPQQPETPETPKTPEAPVPNNPIEREWIGDDNSLLTLEPDGTFTIDREGRLETGTFTFDGSNIQLVSEVATQDGSCRDGMLIFPAQVYTLLSEDGKGDLIAEEFDIIGTWLYSGMGQSLTFSEDGTYVYAEGEPLVSAPYSVEGKWVTLESADGAPVWKQLLISDDGNLVETDTYENWYFPEDEALTFSHWYSEDFDLPWNMDLSGSREILDNTIAYLGENGEFKRVSGEWLPYLQYEELEEGGPRTLMVELTSFSNAEEVPDWKFTTCSNVLFYDYATGRRLPMSDEFFNEEQDGRAGWSYCFLTNGGLVRANITLKSETEAVQDGAHMITTLYSIELPPWYDGLTMAICPVADTAEEALRASLEWPDLVPDDILSVVDAGSALRCRIN